MKKKLKTIARIHATKSGSLKINEIDKPSARFLKEKNGEDGNQYNLEMKEKVITDHVEIQKVITDYYDNHKLINWRTWKKNG